MPSNRDRADADVNDGDGDVNLPNKRAKLLSKACEHCKLKKLRCDSSRPLCDNCRRKGISCIYKEKGQPGLRPGYGKAVEHRLSVLEDNMEKIGESVQTILSHFQTQHNPPGPPPLETANSGPHAGRPAEDDQMWQAPPQISEVASFTESPLVERLTPSIGMTGIANNMDSRLPSEEILSELVELFFANIYPWAPLFHKPSFTANMLSPDRQILLHGIVVLAFRFWTKVEPSVESRERYIKVSREQILLQTIDVCSLTATQALSLLAIDAIGQGPGPRTWNIMSMLVTSAQQLSLARSHSQTDTKSSLVNNEDPDSDLSLSSIEAEEKRRLFWTIYSLDRFSSVSHGQPGAIDSKTIKLPYPASDEDWGQNVALEWFQGASSMKLAHAHYSANLWHHNVDLLTFVDRSNQLLLQPVNLSLPAHCQEWQSSFRRLDITLSTWFENLPREVREGPPSFDPMWTMIHATFHLINIRMYTVAAFPSTTSPYLKPSSSARGRCRQAIRNVASLTTSLQSHEVTQLGPMFAFVVWVAARSLMILWTTGYETTYGAMPTDLESLLNAMRQSAAIWPCAQRYVDIIQLILDTKNNPGGPTGLDVFNDTRRTAYGLQNRLGSLVRPKVMEMYTHYDDFLDLPLLEVGDMMAPRVEMGNFGGEFDSGEWL